MARALCSLEGLSVGDAFGERYFLNPGLALDLIRQRALPEPPWRYTDDTEMALSIASILGAHDEIDQDDLATSFAEHHDWSRGYGAGMHSLLIRIGVGAPWGREAQRQFGGQGSYGNGAAMRVAPIGAYYADDLDRVVEQARRSAVVTHTHPEGVIGAIAVAVAAALAQRLHDTAEAVEPRGFLESVIARVPNSEVREGIWRATELRAGSTVHEAAATLGNGTKVSAQDTVPFVLWCAARHLDLYEEALWLTVGGLGDRDTTCAMVGGIVACSAGIESIPAPWRTSREPLPAWSMRRTS